MGLHSSDPATPVLSSMARMRTPDVSALESALYDEHRLIRHHAMRRTMFVFPLATVRAAHWSTTIDVARLEERRLAGLLEAGGVTDDGIAWIADARPAILAEIDCSGPTTTRAIRAALPDIAVRFDTPRGATLAAHTRVLLVMGFEGSIVRNRPIGTWISSQYLWSTMDSTYPGLIEPDRPLDQQDAERRLVIAYLESFGPATTADVAWWTGWSVTRTRRALDAAGVVAVDLDSGPGWVSADDPLETPAGGAECTVFLPGLDSTVMGWKDRGFYLDPEMTPCLFDRNGNAGPTIWQDGRVVGGWVQLADGGIETEVLTDGVDLRAVSEEAERVASRYGDIRHRVRFPAPLQKDRYR